MKKTLMRLAVVALPLLISACGGVDDIFGTVDGGAGACPTGTTVYRIANGLYPAVSQSASILTDTCQTGVMASQLESVRQISNDGNGNITLSSSDNTTIVGTGPVRCNASTLANGPVTVSDGVCRFTANYSTDLVVTADNAFTMTVKQTRSNPMSEAGQTCTQPSTCTVQYKVSQKM
jgi:hypothetical protein